MFPAASIFEPDWDPARLMSADQYNLYLQRYNQLKPRFAWSDKLEKVYAGFLVHRSMNVPGKVAYFQNIPAMIENRYTRTSPEMFLARALGQAPDQIRTLWGVEVCGNLVPTIHYVENNDPSGWREVYDNGPHSCMAGSNLVTQYAHPDNHLALAYMTHGDGERIICRTIVNREKMQYIRIYTQRGFEEETPHFVAALNMAGFSHSYDAMMGERIHISYGSCFRCECRLVRGPYIDGSSQVVKLDPPPEGSFRPKTAVVANYGEDLHYSTADDDELHCGCEEGDDWDEEDDDDEAP